MKADSLSKAEQKRYARHLILPEFGYEGQEKLKAARVLVIGAGGLGCPVLLYLAAAGVGTLGIVDFDTVDVSNLQRQVLYTMEDIGKSKADAAQKRLKALNPHLTIQKYETRISTENALNIIKAYDVVVDGTDNFPSRYLINDACVLMDKPCVFASIFRFEGQLSVFNFKKSDGSYGPNYRDLFPSPPAPDLVPNCAEGGVLGVLPGILGSFQANEVLKILTGVGEPMVGRLLLFDALSLKSRFLKIQKNPSIQIKALIDYEAFCGIKKAANIKSISIKTLLAWQSNGSELQLIDVREPHEYALFHLPNAALIPLKTIRSHIHTINSQKKVVCYCQTGRRSEQAVQIIEEALMCENLYSLAGGIAAYAQQAG